jgi:hypothetical protein
MIFFILFPLVSLIIIGAFIYSFFLKRHGESERPDPNWLPTEEVFRDPGTDRLMRVWIDPRDSSRHYLVEGKYNNTV